MNDPATPITRSCSGFCRCCGREHFLESGNAQQLCRDLMKTFAREGRLDVDRPLNQADSRLSLSVLSGEARGQMFGVLECADQNNQVVVLKAFSGQFNGIWAVSGWVPPLLDPAAFADLVETGDREIKALGTRIEQMPDGTEKQILKRKRKKLSRDLTAAIHRLYRLHNFRGESASMRSFFPRGIPTGAGDCCAPKLLNHAARNRLKPMGIAEFYWGRANRSGTREQGCFYRACVEKCRPILGFLLCGNGT